MKTVIDKKDNRKELIEEIQSVLLSIAEDKNLSVDKIILFGSIARGDFNENSDLV